MVLRDTRGTPQLITNKRLRNWVQNTFIADLLPELKNTWANSDNLRKGQKSEDLVLKHYLALGYQLIGRNQKIGGVEVDLVLFKSHHLLVEVKTLRNCEEMAFRLKKAQTNRLLFARKWFEDYSAECVELRVAFVIENDVLELGIEDFF